MKLILKEYLSLLKESKELDRLLPDLLLSMGIEPLTHAQVGVRQDGVDVAAVGKDESSKDTLFLFVIKKGDLGRSDWDNGEQAIRPTLNEVVDVYIKNHVLPKHKSLPKKIVLCTGGNLKQDVLANWNGYISQKQKRKLSYEFWGGESLALKIEEHLLNEHVLPNELKSKLRKCLALVADPDYDMSDFNYIVDELLLSRNYGDPKKPSARKKMRKAIVTLNLCLNIVYHWSNSEENLKPALHGAEYSALVGWEFLRQNNMLENNDMFGAYFDIYSSMFRIYAAYMNKVIAHCYVKDGLSGYGSHYIQECRNNFEHLGYMSTAGLLFILQAAYERDEDAFKSATNIADSIKKCIENHPALNAPCCDDHVIEISTTIYLLATMREVEFIDNWIWEIVDNVVFSYHQLGKYFPIQSDSFDDLIALNISDSIDKEDLFKLSTLLPILACWSVVLDLPKTYELISETVREHFPNTVLQIWYPDRDTDKHIYLSNAAYKSGAMDAPMELAASIDDMKTRQLELKTHLAAPETISSLKHGLSALPVISSRHHRTPFLPFYWQQMLELNAQMKLDKIS